jgi:formate/nitrite transporter FocA (FNT family)
MAENDDANKEESEKKEDEEVEERSSPKGSVVYKAIRKEGEDELKRSSSALAWSGLAAGLSMGFSFVGQGLLHAFLPSAKWQPLVVSFGYSLGFLIVVLGRQQLFTENTLTVILPLLTERKQETFINVLRLWTIVLFANLAGALIFAIVIAKSEAFEPDVYQAFITLGKEAISGTFAVKLLRGIFAGWLIALMVWLLPFAETGRIWVIIILTYFVGLGHMSHVIAGASEAFFVAAIGKASWAEAVGGYVLPALIGNVIGGVTLVAAINHAQVVSGEKSGAEDI